MAIHNIYIYSNCDFSTKSAAATRMLYYARSLADSKNTVYLVSCCSSSLDKSNFIEIGQNIFVLEKKQLIRKFWPTLSFLKKLYKFSKENKGDSSFILYPYPYFNLEFLSVLFMVFYKKTKVFYEFNEVKKYSSNFHEPLSSLKLKYKVRALYHKCRFILMDCLMPFYSGLICISTNIEEYAKGYNKNTLRVPILTDPKLKFQISNKTYITNNYFNIGFSGSVVPSKENLLGFISAIKRLNEQGYKVMFNLCGTVSAQNHHLLFEEINENDLKYYGKLDENELSNFLIQQDLLVVPRGYTLQNKYGFSTKLSDYLNHKKVILVTDISDNGLFIEDELNGFVVEPDDDEMMYRKLIHIIDNFKELEEPMIAEAFKVSKNKFDYRLYKNKLNDFLKSESPK